MSKKNSKKVTEGVITDAPYCSEASLIDALMEQGKTLPKPIVESLARPDSPVDEANDAINHDYPWAVASMTSPQRAILCELYRIRKALEAK